MGLAPATHTQESPRFDGMLEMLCSWWWPGVVGFPTDTSLLTQQSGPGAATAHALRGAEGQEGCFCGERAGVQCPPSHPHHPAAAPALHTNIL